jgi:transposase
MDTRQFEIISTVERRRRWTPEEKVAILDDAFRPGGSVAVAADRHGVSRSLIYLWRRKAREGGIVGVEVNEPSIIDFVPVRIDAEPASAARAGAEPTQIGPGLSCRYAGQLEITLTNGRKIKVREGIAPSTLARIVAALDGESR